jgi:hypothetical protein
METYVMKKLLVVAYYFPPAGGSGVQRASKFCKYLPENGWDTVVVTASENAYKILDYSLDKSSSDVKRIDFFDYNRYILKAKKYKVHKAFALLNVILSFPDNKIFWIMKARKEIYKLIEKGNIDAIYITCGPFSSSLIAPFIKKRYPSLPVLLDYRDSWSSNRFAIYLPGYKKINHFLENWVLQHVDAVCAVENSILSELSATFKYTKPTMEITNGFDRNDFKFDIKGPREIGKNQKFTITYIGSFYGKYNPNNIIKAIDFLIENKDISYNEIELVFVGSHDEYKELRKYINCVGYVSHDKVKSYADTTDVLLLIVPSDEPNVLTGKIFEYLIFNKPILAATPPEGIAKKIIVDTNTGYTCDIGNQIDIANKVLKLYKLWQHGGITYNPLEHEINKFSRQKLTRKLAGFLDKIVSG